MKKKYTIIKSVFIIALGSLFFCSSLLAQSPERMSYQAVVRNATQQLVVNQSVGLQFSILHNSPSGTALYVERHTVSTNANGLVSVEIGAGAVQSGSMAGIDWSAGTYFLKSDIDPSGGTSFTITGTSQLISVPYALHSAEAQTVPDGSITSNKLNAAGASAGQILTFNGSSTVWADPLGDISGVDAGDGLFGGASTGNAVLNIGGGAGISIGADAIALDETFTNALYVNEGQVNSITNPMLQSLSVTNDKVSGAGASSGQVLSYNGSNVVWSTPTGGSSVWSLSGSNAYYNAGNVGIGTSSPADGLHLYDAGNDNDLQIQNSYPFLTLNATVAGGNAGLLFSRTGVAYDGWLYHDPTFDAIVICGQNVSLANPNLVVDNTGYVGVGIGAPAYPLDVLGEAHVEGVLWVDNGSWNIGIESVGTNNLALDGDIIPRMGDIGGYDLGNNVADEHWDVVVANTFTVFSDARVKNSIESLSAGLNELMQLRPVKFKYNKNIDKDDKLRFGLIAQEVESVMPNLVINEDVDFNPETGEIIRTPGEFKTLNYMDLIPVLVNAIQEQQQRIEELENTVNSLRVQKLQPE